MSSNFFVALHQWNCYIAYLLQHCPWPIMVVWAAAHGAFYGALSLYPIMAWQHFYTWVWLVQVTFITMMAAYPVATVAAWMVKGRH